MQKEMEKTPKNRDEIAFSTALAKKIGYLPNVTSTKLKHLIEYGPFTCARFYLNDDKTGNAIKIMEKAAKRKEGAHLKLNYFSPKKTISTNFSDRKTPRCFPKSKL